MRRVAHPPASDRALKPYRIDEPGGDFVFARQLPELFHLKGRSAGEVGLISQDLAGAWTGATKPVPYRGHLFADITHGANGLPLDPHMQNGLSAFPAQAGVGGSVVLLVLNDERTAAPINEDRPVSHGTAIMWAASADRVKGPVTRWPSDADLRANYVTLTRSIARRSRTSARFCSAPGKGLSRSKTSP